jgi:uncharacterized protein YvpB
MQSRLVSLSILALLMGMPVSGHSTQSVWAETRCTEGSRSALEAYIPVPFYYQEKDYYCGPAALQMVFNYYGENVSQSEIANVARTIGEPVHSTFHDELRRAAHFSNVSTSMGDEMAENITGYTSRGLGYAAFEAYNMNLTTVKSFTDQGKPLILLMWYSSLHVLGHFRVVTGYNETHVFLHDPWNKPLWGGTYGGPNTAFNNSEFLDLWSYYNNWALYVSPWILNVSAPKYIKPEAPFQINCTVTYPEPLPNAVIAYPASSCNASITPVANLTLAQSETQKNTIGTGLMEAGTNSTISWTLVANSSTTGMMSITAEGMISGSVGANVNYSAYNYIDRIGATANFTITLNEDNSVPAIGTPSRAPEADVQPDQEVRISTNVTDPESGLENVTLFYTIDNGTTWENLTMSLNQSTNLYETTIPGQESGTWVKFKIIAYDHVGNNAILDGTEQYCAYRVVPEFAPFFVIPLFIIVTLVPVIVCRRRHVERRRGI